MPDFDSECFLISPIGDEGSPERKRADGVKRAVVEPAAAKHGLKVVRADEVSEPGTITTQIVEHLVEAKAVVADLTDGNPNVFYELAVRDAAQKSAVLIAQRGTVLPFDKAASRAIFFDAMDLSDAWAAQETLTEFLQASLEGRVENPIATAMIFQQIATSGTPVEQAVAQLGEQISELSADMQNLKRRETNRQNVAQHPPPPAEGEYSDELLALRNRLLAAATASEALSPNPEETDGETLRKRARQIRRAARRKTPEGEESGDRTPESDA